MHILTKAFVFLATVLSIVLSALVIGFVMNADRLRSELSDEQAGRLSAESAMAATSSLAGTEKTRLAEQIQTLQGQVSGMQKEVTQLQSERSQLVAEKERAVADRTAIELRISELGELAKTQANLIEQYRTEVSDLRKTEITSKQLKLEAEDTIADLESKAQVLQANLRAVQEELAEFRRTAGTGTSVAGSTRTGVSAPFTYNGPMIVGRVESVTRDPSSGRTLAKLSVGSNDRVQNNMQMKIVRGSSFVANVVVTQTDLTYSLGAVDTLNRPVEVLEGDTVVSRIVQ